MDERHHDRMLRMTRRRYLGGMVGIGIAGAATLLPGLPRAIANTSLTWQSPQDGDTISGVVTLQVTPPDGTKRVLFYVNGDWVGAAHSEPWAIDIDTAAFPEGECALRANARNDMGQSSARGKVLARSDIVVNIDQSASEGDNEEEEPEEPVEDPNDGEEEEPVEEDPPQEEPEDGDDGDDEGDYEDGEEPVSGEACPLWVHKSYEGAWHTPIDPTYGCYIGHEHGDEPDLDGRFADAGLEPINLNHLVDLYNMHLDLEGRPHSDRPWDDTQYKVQRLEDSSGRYVAEHQYVNVNDNALAAWGEPRYISDRNASYEWASWIPVRIREMDLQTGEYNEFRVVVPLGDIHNKGSSVSEFDKGDFFELHKEDPDGARSFLSDGHRGIAMYITAFTNDRKRGFHAVDDMIRYVFFYRMMDSSVNSSGSMENDYSLDVDDPRPWHTGTMRWTSRATIGSKASKGIYWTDIYCQEILGTGETPPDTDVPVVKQVVGVTGIRHYVHESQPEKALISPTLARVYDGSDVGEPNEYRIRWPN